MAAGDGERQVRGAGTGLDRFRPDRDDDLPVQFQRLRQPDGRIDPPFLCAAARRPGHAKFGAAGPADLRAPTEARTAPGAYIRANAYARVSGAGRSSLASKPLLDPGLLRRA